MVFSQLSAGIDVINEAFQRLCDETANSPRSGHLQYAVASQILQDLQAICDKAGLGGQVISLGGSCQSVGQLSGEYQELADL